MDALPAGQPRFYGFRLLPRIVLRFIGLLDFPAIIVAGWNGAPAAGWGKIPWNIPT